MSTKSSEPRTTYPRFVWPRSGWWLTAISTLAGIVLVLYPPLASLGLVRRIGIVLVLIVVPAFVVVVPRVVGKLIVFARRALDFDMHLTEIDELKQRVEVANLAIVDLIRGIANRHAYRVAYCYAYQNRTFIALRKKRDSDLSLGERITVVDEQTGSVMGEFQVTEEVDGDYRCERVGYMDALWLGNIKQHGGTHSEAPPEALALVTSSITGDEND
jgi:hypothetical protein